MSADDSVALLLIPRRNVETWLLSLNNETVDEDEDPKKRMKAPSKEVFDRAAEAAYAWSRNGAVPGDSCVESLRAALPEWLKIG